MLAGCSIKVTQLETDWAFCVMKWLSSMWMECCMCSRVVVVVVSNGAGVGQGLELWKRESLRAKYTEHSRV